MSEDQQRGRFDDEAPEGHIPSESALRRAREAGIDLSELRREDPLAYRMICSVPVLVAAPELRPVAEGPLHVALPDQHLFDADLDGAVLIMAFPGPGRRQLRVLDDLLAAAVEQEARRRFGYYRVVQDRTGTRRELGLPAAPGSWSGRFTMVGPFESEQAASTWAAANVDPRAGATYDTLEYAGAWFCDIFRAGES